MKDKELIDNIFGKKCSPVTNDNNISGEQNTIGATVLKSNSSNSECFSKKNRQFRTIAIIFLKDQRQSELNI